jgi:hypothetical protein
MDLRSAVQRKKRGDARLWLGIGLLVLALGTALLAAVASAGIGAPASQPATGTPQPDSARLLRVRPSGAIATPTGGSGGQTLPIEAVDEIRGVAGIAKVEAYLFGEAPDGTVVVGIDPLDAALRTAAGQALEAEVVAGRPWVKGDETKPVAYVGTTYGDTHETQFDAIISEMIGPTHSPFVDLGGGDVVNVRAVVETGSEEGNAQVYVPLAFAQEMFGQPGRVSVVYVTVESPDELEAVAQAIRAALGDAAEVQAAP